MLVDNISQTITNPAKTSVAPLPTSAFPMDARTYFESYEDAVKVAATADYQGSKNTIYYYGMTIVVFENNEVNEYVIVRDISKTSGGMLKAKFIENGIILDGGTAANADPENAHLMIY